MYYLFYIYLTFNEASNEYKFSLITSMKPHCVKFSKHDLIKFRIVGVFINSNMR